MFTPRVPSLLVGSLLASLAVLAACGGEDPPSRDDDCVASDCTSPTPSYCEGGLLITSSPPGTCGADGACEYPTQSETCEFGCAGGRCLDAPCDGVVCDAPPERACVNGSAVSYTGPGTCVDGDCEYVMAEENCEAGGLACVDGVCVGVCDPEACETTAPTCDGDVAVTYDAGCDEEGACTETEHRADCADAGEFCRDGACVAEDPCVDIVCDSPPASTCEGNTLTSYTEGVCVAGECDYAATEADCGDQFCVDGACVDEDPCAEVICELSDPYCEGDIAVMFTGTGTCSLGECDVAEVQTDCAATDTPFCVEGVCVAAPCGGACDTPPAPTCEGDERVAYEAEGVCEGEVCVYAEVRSMCDDVCVDGACVDRCEGVSCPALDPHCDADGNVVTYTDAGVCVAGACDYAGVSTATPCEGGAVCAAGACDTGPAVGDLLITELAPNPPDVDDGREWFEVANLSDRTINLDGLVISDEGIDSFTVDRTLEVAPGGFVVFAETEDAVTDGVDFAWPGGGTPSASDSFSLSNTEDEIILTYAGVVMHAVRYSGVAWIPSPGASLQLTRGASADDATDPGAWCDGRSPYPITGHDTDGLGSPGVTNFSCADLCEGVVCDPLPPTCDADTLSSADAGTCAPLTGLCDYDVTTTDCTTTFDGDGGCDAGMCVDLCEGVVCDATPLPTCDGESVVTYAAEGTCARGVCSYPVVDTTACEGATPVCREDGSGAACTDDLCLGVTCPMRSPFCVDNVLLTDSADGSCDPGTGACDYSAVAVPTDCGASGQTCRDATCVTDGVMVGDLVITEIMVNEPGTNAGLEWFEVLNTAGVPLDLDGIEIADSRSGTTVAGGLVVPANGRVIFASSMDAVPDPIPDGAVAYDYAGAFTLNNSPQDSVVLRLADATELDRVDYRSGTATWPDYDDGEALVFDESFVADDNNVGSRWCLAIAPYVPRGDAGVAAFGSPGEPNPPCE